MEDSTTILLVDDQPLNLQAASAVLSQEGYKIIVAKNGRRALELARKRLPDLILLDVMMPDLDGFETCRQLRQEPATADIPVLFLTARTDEADIEAGFAAGGVDYIVKPFSPGELKSRVHTHLKLRRAHRRLKELNELKSRFLAMAAHDLKNPLHSIVGYVEMLMMELEDGHHLTAEDGQTMDMLKTLDSTANHMFDLIHELLEAEFLESGKVEYHPEYCDLNGVVQDVLEMNAQQAARKQIEIEYEAAPNCYSLVDRQSMHEAFDNLLNNAIKYSPSQRTVTVRLSANLPKEGTVRFAVHDQGQGMSETDLHHVFERFRKLSAKPTGGETSTGLGLSIARELVEQQGGSIHATSPGLGKGSIFSIDLPLSAAPDD